MEYDSKEFEVWQNWVEFYIELLVRERDARFEQTLRQLEELKDFYPPDDVEMAGEYDHVPSDPMDINAGQRSSARVGK